MPTNHIADPATFYGTISMLTGADVMSATALRQTYEKLHDNDAYLPARGGAATQAQQEAAIDVVQPVTPGRQHFHPSAATFWAHVTVSAGVPTLQASYDVTGITDSALGVLTETIATNFSSSYWACSASIMHP